jgi:hypothetical protein
MSNDTDTPKNMNVHEQAQAILKQVEKFWGNVEAWNFAQQLQCSQKNRAGERCDSQCRCHVTVKILKAVDTMVDHVDRVAQMMEAGK